MGYQKINPKYRIEYLREKAARRRQKRDYMPWIVTVAFVCILIAIVVTLIKDNDDVMTLQLDSPKKMENSWTLDEETVTLPYRLQRPLKESYVLSSRLPMDLQDGDVLFLNTRYANQEIYINGKATTDRGYLIRVNAADAGKEICIILTPKGHFGFTIPAFRYGNLNTMTAWILSNNLWRIAVCCMLFVLVLIAVFMEIKRKSEHPEYDKNTMNYYATFVFCMMVWLISDSDLPSFVTGFRRTTDIIGCLALAFAGVPYLAFCAQIFPGGRRLMQWLAALGSVYTLIAIICTYTGFQEPSTMQLWSYLYLAIIVLSNIVIVMKEKRTSKYFKKIHVGNMILLITLFLSLASYCIQPGLSFSIILLASGFICFMLILFDVGYENQTNIVQESASTQSYKEMAFTDAMTGLLNRAAYNRMLDNIRDGKIKCNNFTIAMLDVNNLKVINDQIGHQAGDELIQSAARSIQKIFRFRGQCYRIGGDEFVIVLMNQKGKMPFYKERLESELKEFNQQQERKHAPWRLIIALGYAEADTEDMPEGTIGRVVAKADQEMYEDKKQKKAQGLCGIVGMTAEEAEALRTQAKKEIQEAGNVMHETLK